MSERYKFHDKEGLYFVTTTVVDWVDVFTRPDYKEIIIDSLKYNQQHKGLIIHSWVLMTNHLHMIIIPSEHQNKPYNLFLFRLDFFMKNFRS